MPKKKRSKKKTKKLSSSKKKIAGILTATIIAGSSFFVLNPGKHQILLPTYQAIEVYDGDTFLTKERERVRLAALDAPEKGRCGSKQATKLLKELVEDKPLYVKTVFVERNRRLVSYVYSPEGLVNLQLIKSGWVRFHSASGLQKAVLKEASEHAKKNELGIYSSLCLSKEPEKKGCDIKGNAVSKDGARTYLFPGCYNYTKTMVEKDLGDQWFCTVTQAEKAGFERSSGCPDGVKVK